jgi:methyl-accepting chemotaxis protein
MNIENIASIGTLIASFLTPIIVAIIGLIITRKIEVIKNNTAKQKDWETKWGDIFFDSFRKLQESINEIIFQLEKLNFKVSQGTQNDEEGTKIQLHINGLAWDIKRWGLHLVSQLVFLPEMRGEVQNSVHSLYGSIVEIINNRQGNMDKVNIEMENLNKIAREAHKQFMGL